ncbi:hypothetical protein [Thiohalomonas denitrificans]|uniref:Uncharacterized protein n=1 Tax=Thiohalomonas denitrificans TaxID=415747 RepID=A0A1G5PRX0_9GAMM|nr:hypothetical protein [Thiohalomonas denitrificans]SCZ52213.1 hypothetical protein SAMN03097708_00698 [Thiohalomonas denitrificans]
MKILKASIDSWGTERFSAVLKSELEQLRSGVLPIAHAVEKGNRLDESDLGVIINEVSDDEQHIYARVGVFFAQIVECVTCGGGSGARDEAYCELLVTIDKRTGKADFKAL